MNHIIYKQMQPFALPPIQLPLYPTPRLELTRTNLDMSISDFWKDYESKDFAVEFSLPGPPAHSVWAH